MPSYTPPLRDMQFLLHEVFGAAEQFKQLPDHAEVDTDTINAILEEAGKFSAEVLTPLNQVGDTQGCSVNTETHEVTVPDGFAEAYKQYCEGGWPSLSCDPEYGGQGLPQTINQCLYEMLNSANQAWTMYPGLSHGAYDALHAHGTEWQKKTFLPKLVSGEWTGTMCLTEPHCGTDLGMLRTKAEPNGDGTYSITGNKIWISAGEHPMSGNIVHLVLARLPDAPKGTKGISLFLVPKFLVNEDGGLGERNPVICTGLEHKMGIHGNATCFISLEGAKGTLIGEPHKGLNAMFVMMNAARLGVGNQSLGVGEVAYQNALAFAKERIQGRSLTGKKSPDQEADCILVHPDVRKMLMIAKAYTEGARALSLYTTLLVDKELSHPDADVRKEADKSVALLTPIIKAFITDNGFEACSNAMQVLGGSGYTKDWGLEQFLRDSRINMIYEGTNTIQSLDLLGRKVLGDQGAQLRKLGAEVQAFIEAEGANSEMDEFITPLAKLAGKLTDITMEVGMKALQNPNEAGAAAVDYLRILGHLFYGYLYARMAKVAQDKIAAGSTDPFYTAKVQTARFYFARLFPEAYTRIATMRSGCDVLMNTDEALQV